MLDARDDSRELSAKSCPAQPNPSDGKRLHLMGQAALPVLGVQGLLCWGGTGLPGDVRAGLGFAGLYVQERVIVR